MTTALDTPLCQLLGIRYPIVQTGMGWVSGAGLTAATSTAGGLGILAAATLSYDELERAIARIKERTDSPFGVNLRADQPDVRKRAALLIRERVKLASFAQAPTQSLIQELKGGGVLTMPTIGAPRHAEKVAAWGADAVIAQGHEGGGHTGPIPTTLLLPAVCAAVDIPVVAAGGFRDGAGLVAALAFGAAGIAMGTRFLLTKESHVPDAVKQLYLDTPLTGTVVTTSIDGYPQRVIRTPFVETMVHAGVLHSLLRPFAAFVHALRFRKLTGTGFFDLCREGWALKRKGELTWSQVSLAATAPMLTRATMVEGRPDVGILPTGQVVGSIDDLPTVAELIERIIKQAGDTLNRLGPKDASSVATDDALWIPKRAKGTAREQATTRSGLL